MLVLGRVEDFVDVLDAEQTVDGHLGDVLDSISIGYCYAYV